MNKTCRCSMVQVKRKEPLEFKEGDLKRPRPSTPPDDDDEGLSMLQLFRGFKLTDPKQIMFKWMSCSQLRTVDCQKQTGTQLTGTTRGGKRSQEVVNPGSLTARERKHLMAQARRYATL